MTHSLSVTEVRNALRCPRVFVLGRQRGQQVAFPLGASSLGATFHRIVERLHHAARTEPRELSRLAAGAPSDSVRSALERLLLGLLVSEIEANPPLGTMPAEVDELTDALRELAAYMTEALGALGGSPVDALARFSAAAELEVEDSLELPGGATVRVRGRLDALHERDPGALDVVEYKLTAEVNDELDRAQVALYRRLLRTSRGVDAAPVVLRFNPSLTVTRLSSREADSLVDEHVYPMLSRALEWLDGTTPAPPPRRGDLCPACPLRAECVVAFPEPLPARDEPPSGAARPRPDASGAIAAPERPQLASSRVMPGDDTGRAEGDSFQKLVETAFRQQHVAVQMKSPIVGARLIHVEVTAGRSSVKRLDAAADDVVHRLKSDHDLDASYVKKAGLRTFLMPRRTPRQVKLATLMERESEWLSQRAGRFLLGEGLRGEVVRGDLSDNVSCHMLIGGSAGSGKSVLLRAIATSLVNYHPPAAIQLTLVDPKRVTFGQLRSAIGAHLSRPICFDLEETVRVLEQHVEEMEERYRQFEARGVEDLERFNELEDESQRLARHVVIVDEFADLTVDKSLAESFFAAVQRLGNKARAAGIHLVLATQRPDSKTVPGRVKTNLSGKVALKVPNQVSSRIILDQSGAEQLLGNGDMLADLGHGLVRAQGAMA